MKDYLLSEIADICRKYSGNCCLCPFQRSGDAVSCSFGFAPRSWDIDIELRDMVELPCKERSVDKFGNVYWDIYFRNKESNYIDSISFWEKQEDEADKLLERLKEGKDVNIK